MKIFERFTGKTKPQSAPLVPGPGENRAIFSDLGMH